MRVVTIAWNASIVWIVCVLCNVGIVMIVGIAPDATIVSIATIVGIVPVASVASNVTVLWVVLAGGITSPHKRGWPSYKG